MGFPKQLHNWLPETEGYDYFVTKYNSHGVLQWFNRVGDYGTSGTASIKVDSAGSSYVSGHTTVGLFGQSQTGGYDYFIAKYDTNGSLQWGKADGREQGIFNTKKA